MHIRFKTETLSFSKLLLPHFAVNCVIPLLVLSGYASATTAHIDQPIASPVFVNLYWDAKWDADNPDMKVSAINAITRAIVNSSYFSGLAEYGVKSASFAGGFGPDSQCPSKAPSNV